VWLCSFLRVPFLYTTAEANTAIANTQTIAIVGNSGTVGDGVTLDVGKFSNLYYI
jgi:hypothetical protein